MSLGGALTRWSLDGTISLVFSLLNVVVAIAYLGATEVGRRRDRRGRRWPPARTLSFLAGLAILLYALDGWIGIDADSSLAAHMAEHMVIWLVVAPLLVIGAPLRLALYATRSPGRRRLARLLHSPPIRALSRPAVSTTVFTTVVLLGQIPAVYDLVSENDLIHVGEHALYLATAVLVWAPQIGADPLPFRPGLGSRCRCLLACMGAMAAVSVWLIGAGAPLYQPFAQELGAAGALTDQRLAGAITLACGLPALALAVLATRGGWRPGRAPAPRGAARTRW